MKPPCIGKNVHELGIANSIVETVIREITARKLIAVSAVAVRIGSLAGVDPEALRFGFEVITRDTQLAGTRLKIEAVTASAHCGDCGTDFQAPDFLFVCPKCGGRNTSLTRGQELDIAYLEIEDGELG